MERRCVKQLNSNLSEIIKIDQRRIILLSHKRLKFQYKKLSREFKKKESVNKHKASGIWENKSEIPTPVYTVLIEGI